MKGAGELWLRVDDKRGIAQALNNLGVVARMQGDPERAAELCRTSLRTWAELGNRWDITDCLEDLAAALTAGGDAATGTRLLGAAEALREETGTPLAPAERAIYEQRVTEARRRLDEETFTKEWSRGRGLTLEEAIAAALIGDARIRDPPP